MSHTIRREEHHDFDLTAREQFEYKGYHKTPVQIDRVYARLVDGSLSIVRLYGRPVLKSGQPGMVIRDFTLWKPYGDDVTDILRAHGIPVA